MNSKHSYILAGFIFSYSLASIANENGLEVCKTIAETPIFSSEKIQSSSTFKESYRKLMCSAQFSSSQEIQNAGLDVNFVYEQIPIEVGASWESNKHEQWKSKNCSNEERNSNFLSTYFKSVTTVDPASAKAALACVDTIYNSKGQEAIKCSVKDLSNSVAFEAFWLRSNGEKPNAAPKVKSFEFINSKCKPQAGTFAKNDVIDDGGMSILCKIEGKDAPAFILNTSRGSCSSAGDVRMAEKRFEGKIALTAPYVINGQDVVFSDKTLIVTNGYQFSVQAKKIRIEGTANIVSFESPKADKDKYGNSASKIEISSNLLSGGALVINNAGQSGGDNSNIGQRGLRGAAGKPGDGRTYYLLKGCSGGDDGGTGGVGGKGFQGPAGYSGGNGGLVTIDVPISQRPIIKVLTDIDLGGKPQICDGKICGGLGGSGGLGGPGGDGGSGGEGAPGTKNCGGTNAGQPGPLGPNGENGDAGNIGQHASIKYQ